MSIDRLAAKRAGIIGIGMALPNKIVANEDLEKLVDTSDEWITTRTGIKTRRVAEQGTSSSTLGAKAAERALKNANVTPEDIDLIIVATITPDMQFPSTSCLIQHKIKAHNAACMDISAACSGYIYAISMANSYIISGMYKTVLVIGVEILSSITDWTDRSTCVLFGDGAGAAVISGVKKGGILSTYLGADGAASEILKVPAGGSLMPTSIETVNARQHYIKMQGSEVFKCAVRIMSKAAQTALEKCNVSIDQVKCLIPHQANIRIIDATIERLGISREKVYINVEKYGNMSSASSAVALCEAVKDGCIKKGDIVVQVAFGSGLTWGATVLEWSV